MEPAVSMAAAEDLLREVLTRKSNETQWIRGSGHEKVDGFWRFFMRTRVVALLRGQKNGHGHYL